MLDGGAAWLVARDGDRMSETIDFDNYIAAARNALAEGSFVLLVLG